MVKVASRCSSELPTSFFSDASTTLPVGSFDFKYKLGDKWALDKHTPSLPDQSGRNLNHRVEMTARSVAAAAAHAAHNQAIADHRKPMVHVTTATEVKAPASPTRLSPRSLLKGASVSARALPMSTGYESKAPSSPTRLSKAPPMSDGRAPPPGLTGPAVQVAATVRR